MASSLFVGKVQSSIPLSSLISFIVGCAVGLVAPSLHAGCAHGDPGHADDAGLVMAEWRRRMTGQINNSSLRWLEIDTGLPTSKGSSPSLVQLGTVVQTALLTQDPLRTYDGYVTTITADLPISTTGTKPRYT
jgi:hypothetical protein